MIELCLPVEQPKASNVGIVFTGSSKRPIGRVLLLEDLRLHSFLCNRYNVPSRHAYMEREYPRLLDGTIIRAQPAVRLIRTL